MASLTHSFHDFGAAALRAVEPELAHRMAVEALARGLGPKAECGPFPHLATNVAGLALPNPLGLAAGFDKNAEVPDALLAAGFGFVECGTVTPRPQEGNPKPRLFRLTADRAVINRMGFNNEGLDAFVARLKARAGRGGIVGANIGANKDSADRVADYVAGLKAVWPLASYVTVNVSSPNTPGLRGLQEKDALEALLSALWAARLTLNETHSARPMFLKVAPDLDEAAIDDIVAAALANHVDGLIVSNTTIQRPTSLRAAARIETGGLSGRPLFESSTGVLRAFARAAKGRLALIGAGGVESGAHALAKIKAGASAVQLYTALVYEGPGLAARILEDLSRRLRAEGFARVADAVGADLH